jgi:hypothetical protein
VKSGQIGLETRVKSCGWTFSDQPSPTASAIDRTTKSAKL